MAKKSPSSKTVSQPPDDLIDQNLLEKSDIEACSFTNRDIRDLIATQCFPPSTGFRSFDPQTRADMYSKEWVCFPEHPFNLGFTYPFPPLVTEFFRITGLAYSQVMPMVWRFLYAINNLNLSHNFSIGIPEIAHSYNLQTHGRSRFILKIKSGREPFILKTTQNDPEWRSRFFFVKRSSIPDGDKIPHKWILKTFVFEELAPAKKDTVKKVNALLKLPNSERNFKIEASVSETSVNTSSAASMSRGTRGKIAMSEINSLLDAPVPKKGKKAATESPSKPPTGTVQVIHNRKRKTSDVVELDSLEAHDPEQLRNLMYSSVDKVIDSLKDLKKKKEIAEASNEELKSKSASLADKVVKDAQELKALRKEIHCLKDTASRHQQELDNVRQGALASAAALVLEGKIKLVKEIKAPDFDFSSIDLEAWEAKLAFLKDEDTGAADGEADKVGAGNEEAEKGPEGGEGEKDVTPGDDSDIAKA